jgi:anti-sigma B factor antagonist
MNEQLPRIELAHTQVMEIVGRLDNANTPRLVEAVNDALSSGRSYLVLDLNGVDYMNSAGLRQLVRILERVRNQGGILYITNPSERVNKLLELVGLDSVIEIHTDSSLGLDTLTNGDRSILTRNTYYYT